MEARHSLYREVHKGIRRMMLELVTTAGRTDYTNPDDLTKLREEARNCFELLSSHAHHENEFTAPIVHEHAPALSHLVAPAHDEQEEEIALLMDLLNEIDPGSANTTMLGNIFTVRLSSFFGDLLIHMADEEERIMPALWRAMTDEQLIEVEQRLVESIAPGEMATFLEWMIPAMNHPERVAMLSGMREGAPAEVFTGVLELSRELLTASDFAALERALAIQAA